MQARSSDGDRAARILVDGDAFLIDVTIAGQRPVIPPLTLAMFSQFAMGTAGLLDEAMGRNDATYTMVIPGSPGTVVRLTMPMEDAVALNLAMIDAIERAVGGLDNLDSILQRSA